MTDGWRQADRVAVAKGEAVDLAPVEGFAMYAVPSRFLRNGGLFVAVRAFAASGKEIDERGISVQP